MQHWFQQLVEDGIRMTCFRTIEIINHDETCWTTANPRTIYWKGKEVCIFFRELNWKRFGNSVRIEEKEGRGERNVRKLRWVRLNSNGKFKVSQWQTFEKCPERSARATKFRSSDSQHLHILMFDRNRVDLPQKWNYESRILIHFLLFRGAA